MSKRKKEHKLPQIGRETSSPPTGAKGNSHE